GPAGMNQQRRIIERSGRGVDDLAVDAAILTGLVRDLAELDERVLPGEALPAAGGAIGMNDPRIDAAGRSAAAPGGHRRRGVEAVGRRAIPRARYPQVGGP